MKATLLQWSQLGFVKNEQPELLLFPEHLHEIHSLLCAVQLGGSFVLAKNGVQQECHLPQQMDLQLIVPIAQITALQPP